MSGGPDGAISSSLSPHLQELDAAESPLPPLGMLATLPTLRMLCLHDRGGCNYGAITHVPEPACSLPSSATAVTAPAAGCRCSGRGACKPRGRGAAAHFAALRPGCAGRELQLHGNAPESKRPGVSCNGILMCRWRAPRCEPVPTAPPTPTAPAPRCCTLPACGRERRRCASWQTRCCRRGRLPHG